MAQPVRELLRRHPLTAGWLAACLARPAYRPLCPQAQPDGGRGMAVYQ